MSDQMKDTVTLPPEKTRPLVDRRTSQRRADDVLREVDGIDLDGKVSAELLLDFIDALLDNYKKP